MEGNALAVLGLSSQEEAVYRLLLRSPGVGLTVIAHVCGTSQDDAQTALARLRDLGVVRAATDRSTFSGVDPATAVDRLARLRIHGLQGEIRQVASSRHLIDTLTEDQQACQRAAISELQQVDGLDQVIACVDELSFFAREERLTTHPGPILTGAFDAVRTSDLKYLRRGLAMRTIVHADALDCRQVNRFTSELTEQGAQVRGTTGPLERMVIFDRRTALVATDPDGITRGALIVHQPGLLAHLLSLFEHRWSQGCTVPDELPTTAERHVLQVMARVDKDETGARELGMSLRTYRSHVAALLRRLDAPNRFQAALAARDRRWL
ncbi:helix-turn-helix transcriptional regulator [Streptomyces melanogenes]|uniref:helix-turn-helix transcriptional regulator n=1 Tax=Streptomyces melanogenes TaxID=67326 RepID=UPI00378B7A19